MLTITDLPDHIVGRINFNGPPPPDPARTVVGGCWLWTGGKFLAGYGSVWIDSKSRLVHQVVFEVATGSRSDRSMFVDHICRVRACCNPEHLELVSPEGNQISAQRDHCRNGHEFTPLNTGRVPGKPNRRVCRKCSAAAQRRFRERRIGKC